MIPQYTLDSLQDLKRLLKQHPTDKNSFNQAYPVKLKGRVETLADFAYNSLFNETIKLTATAAKELSPYKKHYLHLSAKNISLKQKKKLVSDKGHLFAYPLVKVMLPKLPQ